jgi:hypothetical protein
MKSNAGVHHAIPDFKTAGATWPMGAKSGMKILPRFKTVSQKHQPVITGDQP